MPLPASRSLLYPSRFHSRLTAESRTEKGSAHIERALLADAAAAAAGCAALVTCMHAYCMNAADLGITGPRVAGGRRTADRKQQQQQLQQQQQHQEFLPSSGGLTFEASGTGGEPPVSCFSLQVQTGGILVDSISLLKKRQLLPRCSQDEAAAAVAISAAAAEETGQLQQQQQLRALAAKR
ncbi:hypothetical protein Efla_000809 [Eimeria flavescens]